MIIIKKANAYLYHFGPLECECQRLHSSDERIPYCTVTFKLNKDLIPENQPILNYVLSLFSQICLDKAYFIPHFYFRIKDIILISGKTDESLFAELEDSIIQKINRQYFFTGKPLQWQEQWQCLILPASCSSSK